MYLTHKLFSIALIFDMLFTPMLGVAQNHSQAPLSQVQTQAKKDFAIFKNKYGTQAPATLWANIQYPMLMYLLQINDLQEKLTDITKINEMLMDDNLELAQQNIRLTKQVSELSARANKVPIDFPPYLMEEITEQERELLIRNFKENFSALYNKILQSNAEEIVPLYDKEVAPILRAIQNSERKQALAALESSFPTPKTAYRYDPIIPFDEYKARKEIVERLCADTDLFPKTAAERLTLTKEYMRELNTLFIHGRQPSKVLAKNIAKYILSRNGLLSVGLVMFGGVALLAGAHTAHAAESDLAKRLRKTPTLFLNATPGQLAEIEADKSASDAARQIAQTLQAANALPERDMYFLLQSHAQQPQQKIAKKEIIKALKTVQAY